MEKEIEKRRNQLREAEAGDQGDPDLDNLPFGEEDDYVQELYGQDENPDDDDPEYMGDENRRKSK